MNILLLGKNGQVGHALQAALSPLGTLTAWGRAEADLADPSALRAALARGRWQVIVNAAAYTAVDRAEQEGDIAHAINASAVRILAEYAAATGALLVHYSTDYVFDGTQSSPYRETDTPHPLSEYGRSKWLGECAVFDSGCRALVLRTSWVFSSHGGNFIQTILRLAKERESLNVVADQFGAPTSADWIARLTARAIAAVEAERLPPGLYHLTAGGETSWHGLASFVVDRAQSAGVALRVATDKIVPVATEHYPLPAHRPKNSRLDCTALYGALGVTSPDWRDEVARVVDEWILSKGAS